MTSWTNRPTLKTFFYHQQVKRMPGGIRPRINAARLQVQSCEKPHRRHFQTRKLIWEVWSVFLQRSHSPIPLKVTCMKGEALSCKNTGVLVGMVESKPGILFLQRGVNRVRNTAPDRMTGFSPLPPTSSLPAYSSDVSKKTKNTSEEQQDRVTREYRQTRRIYTVLLQGAVTLHLYACAHLQISWFFFIIIFFSEKILLSVLQSVRQSVILYFCVDDWSESSLTCTLLCKNKQPGFNFLNSCFSS